MKHLLTLLFKLVALAALFGCAGCNQSGSAVGESSRQTNQADDGTNGSAITLEKRQTMAESARLRWLEQNGRVPEDADQKDWELAGQASWWGRPIDAKEFWKGRVIWCDVSARSAAAVRGRDWPPIPYDEATLARLYPDFVRAYPVEGETIWSRPGIEGPSRAKGGAVTAKEIAFWMKFMVTHPHPPEELEQAQQRSAERYLKLMRRRDWDSDPRLRRTPEEAARSQDSETRRAVEMGYPPEMFSEQALLSSYVLKQRIKYQELLDNGSSPDSVAIKAFFNRLLVETNYIYDPPTLSQSDAANTWKISYLQRLRREKVDKSYINAYLKAWNLAPSQVFGTN